MKNNIFLASFAFGLIFGWLLALLIPIITAHDHAPSITCWQSEKGEVCFPIDTAGKVITFNGGLTKAINDGKACVAKGMMPTLFRKPKESYDVICKGVHEGD